MRLREIAEEPRHNDWTSPKNLAKYILVVILTFVGYYGVSGSVMGFQALELKNQVKEFSHQLKTGGGASSEAALAARINKSIVDLNSTLTNPFWSPLTNHFLADAQSEINLAAQLVRVAPNLLGAQSPKKYLLVFQNSAEARGTGGIIGAYAEIQVYRGAMTVLKQGSNVALKSLNEIPIAMPAEFVQLYGSDPAIWQNSNLSPHFPYGAQIWLALWQKQYGEKLDGVIAVDPTALSYLLRATGPVVLKSGEQITAASEVYKTLSEAYKTYEKNNDARKQYLVNIMNATFAKITAGQYSKITMAKSMGDPIDQGRILVYSTDPASEAILSKTRLGGFMSTAANNEYRAVIQNIDASKLDYYLSRSVSIKALKCSVPRVTQVTMTVKNTLASGEGLPQYVLTRSDLSRPETTMSGQHHFQVFVYGPTGSTLVVAQRSSVNGSPDKLGTERGRPVLVVDEDLAPLAGDVITATFSGGVGPITYVDQPLVLGTAVSISDNCT